MLSAERFVAAGFYLILPQLAQSAFWLEGWFALCKMLKEGFART